MSENSLDSPSHHLSQTVDKYIRVLRKGVCSQDEFCFNVLLQLAASGLSTWERVLKAVDCEILRLLVCYCDNYVGADLIAPAELFFQSIPSKDMLEAKREELKRAYLSLSNALKQECKARCGEDS